MGLPSFAAATVACLLVLAAFGQLAGFADAGAGLTLLLLALGAVLAIVVYVSNNDHRSHGR